MASRSLNSRVEGRSTTTDFEGTGWGISMQVKASQIAFADNQKVWPRTSL